MKREEGITLIALIITIVILVTLAAITVKSVMNSDLIGSAIEGSEDYINEQFREQQIINDIYSTILVADNDNAQITISVKDLKSLIQEEVDTKVSEAIKTEDITNFMTLNTDYVSKRISANLYKSGNVITLTAYLNIDNNVDNPETTIIKIDEKYAPKVKTVELCYLSR